MTESEFRIKYAYPCGMSRSGTTLLATMLDSHPRISIAYELIPAGLPPIPELIELIQTAFSRPEISIEQGGQVLRAEGNHLVENFVKRCHRARLTPRMVIDILMGLGKSGYGSLDALDARTRLSLEVAETKKRLEGTLCCGFKLNSPSVETVASYLPADSGFIFILRDPRDVVASHFANNFNRTLAHIVTAWNKYLGCFREFSQRRSEATYILRYEDLVSDSRAQVQKAFAAIGIPFSEEVMHFYASKASVHQGGHVNARQLKQEVFTSSLSRWERELTKKQIGEIESACGMLMSEYGYSKANVKRMSMVSRIVGMFTPSATIARGGRSSPDAMYALKTGTLFTKRAQLRRKKFVMAKDYSGLLAPYIDTHEIHTCREAAANWHESRKAVLVIRHDIDHDHETALKIAKWELSHSIRSTYCVLHTAWYYGERRNGKMFRTRNVVDLCLELQELGHEVVLHNNCVASGLRDRIDPYIILAEELEFLRSHKVDIHGTSSHGDALCREIGFRNFELFKECVLEANGGARVIEYQGYRVDVGRESLSVYGLEYEAYDLPRAVYLTDAGGNLRTRTDTKGRGGKRHNEMQNPPGYREIVGVLTHPEYWDFN